MSNEAGNDNLMGAPHSSIRDGLRWGRAEKDMPFANGHRIQKIGDKIIRHKMHKEKREGM